MSKVELHAIVAYAQRTRCIGANNAMPWPVLKTDMRRFQRLTKGHPVIMGRKTHESIGKVLPGRINIILSRSLRTAPEGCMLARDLTEAVALCETHGQGRATVIGGADIYEQMLPLVSRVFVTEIDIDVDGDAHFPVLDAAQWRSSYSVTLKDETGIDLRFSTYTRCGAANGRG